MGHFNDKTRHCTGCDRDIHIPHNQVGGFWYLSGWTDKDGNKLYGGYCSPCFHKLADEKEDANRTGP